MVSEIHVDIRNVNEISSRFMGSCGVQTHLSIFHFDGFSTMFFYSIMLLILYHLKVLKYVLIFRVFHTRIVLSIKYMASCFES